MGTRGSRHRLTTSRPSRPRADANHIASAPRPSARSCASIERCETYGHARAPSRRLPCVRRLHAHRPHPCPRCGNPSAPICGPISPARLSRSAALDSARPVRLLPLRRARLRPPRSTPPAPPRPTPPAPFDSASAVLPCLARSASPRFFAVTASVFRWLVSSSGLPFTSSRGSPWPF